VGFTEKIAAKCRKISALCYIAQDRSSATHSMVGFTEKIAAKCRKISALCYIKERYEEII